MVIRQTEGFDKLVLNSNLQGVTTLCGSQQTGGHNLKQKKNSFPINLTQITACALSSAHEICIFLTQFGS